MRVSTSMLYALGSDQIGKQQSALLRTQQQLSSGRRMLSPSDDPVAAAQALREGQAKAMAGQYAANQDSARASLAQSESVLGDAGAAIADARTLLVAANNAILSDADRRSMALELRNHYDRLLGLANTRGADGEFLFSGYKGGTQAFAATATGAAYSGDEGVRSLAVADGRSMPVSANGASIFERVPGGNGVFTIAPGAGNVGSGVHDAGSVANSSLLTGHDYRVIFDVTAGVTTYDVLDVTLGANVVTGAAWASGQSIAFDGLQLRIDGAPADNDRFDIAPSSGTSVFATLKGLAALLEAPVQSPSARAALNSGLASGLAALDQAAERVLQERARMGAHLQELDSLGDLVSSQSLQHEQELSRLGDLDYAEAITRFSAQQAALQAAQQSFLRVSSLSLFEQI